jgi:hypothetical protein
MSAPPASSSQPDVRPWRLPRRAPTMARLVTQAIETGYVTALRDMRDRKIEL